MPIKEWLVLSKNERRGVTVLIVILLMVSVFRFLIPVLFDAPEITVEENRLKLEQIKRQYDSLENASEIRSEASQYSRSYANTKEKLFPSKNQLNSDSAQSFDPNSITIEEMVGLGFSEKLATTINNYRNKGGRFYKVDDLLKIYGFDSIFFEQVKPYVIIEKEGRKKKKEFAREEIKVEINSADTTAFKKLPGIGSAFSNRICNYRKKLGGFYSIKQIGEVYGLPHETFECIEPMLEIDTTAIVKIDINFSDYADLVAHPYLKKGDVKRILEMRNKRGPFVSKHDLLDLSLLDEDTYKKMAPYMKP